MSMIDSGKVNKMQLPNFLCIGIAAYNEAESIQKALEHIFRQSLWKAMPAGQKEIIVCANGCTDKTPEIVRAIMKEHPEVKLIEISQKSKVAAWKRIVNASNPKAPVLFFVDADVIVHHKALERLWNAFRENPSLYLVGGFAIPFGASESKGRFMKGLNKEYRARVLANKPGHLSGALYGISRTHALELSKKMPDNLLVEDRYIQLMTPKERYAKVFDAKVYFKPPLTIKDFLKQQRRFERGRRQLVEMGIEKRAPAIESVKSKVEKAKGLPLSSKVKYSLLHFGSRIYSKMPAFDFWPKNVSSKLKRHRPRA